MTSTFRSLLGLAEEPRDDRVLLFDGHSLAYRSYYAIRDLTTGAGLPVNALYGFWQALRKTLRDYPSAFVAVAFDAGGETFRQQLFAAYKATRRPIPEDLAAQLPLIQRLLDALGIPVVCEPGVEADDVLGTLARDAVRTGLSALIVTSDKDLAQLVGDRVALVRPTGRGTSAEQELLDPPGVVAKYGVRPEQMVDLLALIGDASDNVPGVPSVGEKTARRLLDAFGSLEEILRRTGEVKNERVRRNLEAHADAARLSRKLIELDCSLDIGSVRDICRLRSPDPEALGGLFSEVEFHSALEETHVPLPGNPIETRPARVPVYETVLTEEDLRKVVAELHEVDGVAFDLETTSTDPMDAHIVGLAVSPRPWIGYYIPVAHDVLGSPRQIPLDLVLEALRPLLEDTEHALYGQNLKYDITVLAEYGVCVRGIEYDTMLASHLAAPDVRRHNLETIAQTYLGWTVSSYADVAGKGGSFASVPIDKATMYAAEDAEIVQRLRTPLMEAVEATGGTDLLRDVEIPLIPVLARMERAGILVDPDELARQGEDLRAELAIIEGDLFEMAGVTFNPNSPKQVSEVLFERLRLPVIDRTKTGPSTSAQVLAELARFHPLPGKLAAHREIRKLLTTYIDQLPKTVNEKTGRIHTSFHQTATATGRLSSSDPNLQNIPSRTEIGGRIRRAFIAPPGHVLVSADYSQIELRLLAHFSRDENLLAAFDRGSDLHTLTASRLFDVEPSAVTESQRTVAKRVNFGILYGISPYGLGRDLGILQSEAKVFIDRFFAAYPQARQMIDDMVEQATRQGYAETLLGRRRPLPNLRSRNASRRNFDRRNAVNTPIQGSAADLIKLAMLQIDREQEQGLIPGRMLLQIHDELVFEVPESETDVALPRIVDAMTSVMSLRVHLDVKTQWGRRWSEI